MAGMAIGIGSVRARSTVIAAGPAGRRARLRPGGRREHRRGAGKGAAAADDGVSVMTVSDSAHAAR